MNFDLIGYGTAVSKATLAKPEPAIHGLIVFSWSGFTCIRPDGETQWMTAQICPGAGVFWDVGYPLQAGLPWVICTMPEDTPKDVLGGEEFYDVAAMRRRLNAVIGEQAHPLVRVYYGLVRFRIEVERYAAPTKPDAD